RTFVASILECIEDHGGFLLRSEFGEVILCNIEFDLDVIQIGQRDNRPAWTTFGAAGKLRRYQFALFSCAFKNRAADGRLDGRRVELSLGIVHLALRLQHIGAGTLYLLAARTDFRHSKHLLERIRALLGSVIAGGGIVKRLFGNYSLSE